MIQAGWLAGLADGGKIPVVWSDHPTWRQPDIMWSDQPQPGNRSTTCLLFLVLRTINVEILPGSALLVIFSNQGTPSVNLSNNSLAQRLFAKLARILLSNIWVVGDLSQRGEMKQKTACISPFLHLNSLSTRAEIVPEQIWNMKLPVGLYCEASKRARERVRNCHKTHQQRFHSLHDDRISIGLPPGCGLQHHCQNWLLHCKSWKIFHQLFELFVFLIVSPDHHQHFLVVLQISHNMTGSQLRITWFWQNTIKCDLWPIGFFLKKQKKRLRFFSISVGSGQSPIKRQLSQNLTRLISIKLHEEKWGNKTMGTSHSTTGLQLTMGILPSSPRSRQKQLKVTFCLNLISMLNLSSSSQFLNAVSGHPLAVPYTGYLPPPNYWGPSPAITPR